MRNIVTQLQEEFETQEVMASLFLLGQLFSDDGWSRFRSLYREYYRTFYREDLATAIEAAAAMTTDLRKLGCITLSRLVEI
jgi:hypothetical protein